MSLLVLLQILVGLGLSALILIQSRGTGLGREFGGGSLGYHSRKGLERYVMVGTVVLAVVFTVLALVNIAA